MQKIQWDVKRFRQLSIDELFHILQLRIDVFVVEQQCAYPELDDYDRQKGTRHLCGWDESRSLITYARILPPGLRFPEVNVGRFVVRKASRGQGIGHQLLGKALKVIQKTWLGNDMRISAQDYLQKFYEQYGFVRVSDVYLEDGIPHIEMIKKPA